MRLAAILLAATAALAAQPVLAAEALKYGPPPSWVVPQAIPETKPTNAPVAILLSDEQIKLDHGKTTGYSESAFRIQTPQGLSAGNISLSWQPATETLTVNKLQILRGGKTIDVLAGGQAFTTMRRETNLEAATLDGTLTANIQPEGLQEGDVVLLATTIERYDPVLRGHTEVTFAQWNGEPIAAGHVHLSWPADEKIIVRAADTVPTLHRTQGPAGNSIDISATDIQPLILPTDAPDRFQMGRYGEATDFASWADVAKLMTPLFRDAAVLPSSGPLHDELEHILTATTDPKKRAQLALALVQDRVRYVALLMGQGGYVPASAQATWSRRFGDCKAKTALLLALLKGLGIEAEPVLVNVGLGDVVSDRLPALSLFNHVLVRAHISGKYYWLDGTRTGDSDLDRIDVPDFGWVLPLVPNATLVHLVPPPRNRPDFETIAEIDASNGIYTAAKASVEEILRRDYAVALNNALTAITPSQQQEFFAKLWQKDFDLITPGQTSFSFDKQTGELRLSMKGEAKLDWSDGYFHVPNSSVGFKPNFDRRPGPFHDAPISVAYPMFTKAVTVIRMPHGFFAPEHAPITPATETLAGTEYRRTPTESGDALTVETSTRSLVPEIPYKQALADAQRLKVLADEDVSLRVPRTYKLTQADIDSTKKDEITSTTDLVTRGNLLLDAAKPELAISLLTKAISNDPKNVTAIADRAISYFWAKNLEAAEKDLASAEAIEPDNAIVLRTRGIMAESKGDCSKAVGFYTRSLVKEPENGFALGHRAMCEYNLGKDSEALSDSELALKSMPSWMNLRLLRANVLLHSNKREAVEQEAQLLIKDNPQSDFAYVAAAKIYSRLGEQEKAMQTFDRALAVKPLAYIYLNREQIRRHDDFKARLLDLDAGLKLEPDNSDLLVEKARLLSSTGDYKGALALLDRLKPEPDDLYAQMQRAVVLYKAGRLAEARPILDSLRAKAKTPMELNNLCWSKATADIALDSAVHDCEDALKLNPDAGQILDSLGMALLKSGKLDEALAAYDKAVAKSTGAASFMGRAFVYVRKGDSAHAMADRAQALKLDPKIEERFADYGLKFDQSSSSAHAAQ